MLIAINHPNSFLDAIIISTLFDAEIHSLARGDVFSKKWSANLLKQLNIFPVFRRTEGVENLENNYQTFDQCKSVFRKGGIVLIFSEGRCINEWKLRPLGKGTARLAISSWEEHIPLRVLPIGINYQSFRSFGKNVIIHIGDEITEEVVSGTVSFGQSVVYFNKALTHQLKKLVIAGDMNEPNLRSQFVVGIPSWQRLVLSPFAFSGYMLHAPMYIPVRKLSLKKAAPFEHYDSVIVGVLFLLYPFYLIAVYFVLSLFLMKGIAIAITLCMPFFAWSFVRLKRQW